MPIKELEEQFNKRQIKRCHRSYIINESKIVSVRGNAQGLKLSLSNVEEEVPVSRSYLYLFR
jgi:DNA-binding LytR/AlgR family response regulator